MNQVRTRAVRLRREGKSYNEIKKEITVSKSTLSLWLRDVTLSAKARARLDKRVVQGVRNGFIRRNKAQTPLAWKRARKSQASGRKEIRTLSSRDLLLIGTALYWAEGYKRLRVINGTERAGHVISFVNSDPDMVQTFIVFTRTWLAVPSEKFVVYMRLYPHINEFEAKRYWMNATGLPETCFRRSSYLISSASKYRRPFNRLPFGTLQIQVLDTQKFHRLLGMIERMKERIRYDTVVPSLGSSVS